jgi:hypothetical protein
LVWPGAIESFERLGFGLARPDSRNCSSYVIVPVVGFVTQTDVVKSEPSAPCTCPAAGTMRSVPVNPSGVDCAAMGKQLRRSRRTTATVRPCM